MKKPKKGKLIRLASARGPDKRERQHQRMIGALCDWFDHHARQLPWRTRRSRNGYTALVAESMLQQTQVSRVIDAYTAFIRQFPNVRSLASADEQDVLALWKGLGYYRRAKHLHRAACMVVQEFAGRVPRTVEQLLQLPGVGRYTAGAIASIVHGEAAPIVDGNVQRVLMRWQGRIDHHGGRNAVKWAWGISDDYVRRAKRPGVFNEALMELGALVCTPRNPRCDQCPAAKWCEARRRNIQDQIPRAGRRAVQRSEHHHAVAITRHGKVLIEKRAASANGRMWESMWQVPTIESERALSEIEIKRALPIRIDALVKAGAFDHHTSHRRIRFHVYRAKSRARTGDWREVHQILQLPLSNAQRRVIWLMSDAKIQMD